MRFYLIVFTTGIFIFMGCTNVENPSAESEILKLEKSVNCDLAFVEETKSNKITIHVKCEEPDVFFSGKIIFEAYQNFKKANIKRDVFQLKKSDGILFYALRTKDLAAIEASKNTFDAHFEELISSERNVFERNLDSTILSQTSNTEWYDLMYESLKKNKREWIFGGFGFKEKNGEEYILLANKIQNEVIIYFAYKTSKSVVDKKIYGLEVIPLSKR